MSENTDKDTLIEQLLQERDEMYLELSRFRKLDYKALEEAEKRNEHLDKVIQEKDEKIRKLTDQLSWYMRKFWRPSSEKFIPQDPNQRKIDFEGLDILPEEEASIKEAEKEVISYERIKPSKEKKQPVRLPLPEYLRREEETIEPEGIDENWVRIGEEITEVLEHKPGELFVRRIVRPKYALKRSVQQNQEETEQEQVNIRIAALPALPLPRSNAGASLLAELLMGKYMYHLPFHRQIAIMKLTGIALPASTVNGWFQGSCDLLRALYYRLREVVLATDYIMVDESTVPVIDNEKKKAVKAYLWMVRAVMDKLVFFHYDKGSRAQKVVVELLRDFKGAVQADGYEAYSIYENKKGVLLLGCWAHARRKFEESLKEDRSGAEYALNQIGLLYRVETMADDQKLDNNQRAELRKRLAYPILCAFEKWIVSYYPKVFPRGRMGKALAYT
jgi:transposase